MSDPTFPRVPPPHVVHWKMQHPMNLALCGVAVLSRDSATEAVEHLTCEDCILRLLAALHHDTAVLMKTLTGRVVSLRNALGKQIVRD